MVPGAGVTEYNVHEGFATPRDERGGCLGTKQDTVPSGDRGGGTGPKWTRTDEFVRVKGRRKAGGVTAGARRPDFCSGVFCTKNTTSDLLLCAWRGWGFQGWLLTCE